MTCKFTILSTQRTGSTWVVDMLNSHQAVKCYSELLLENARGIPKWGGAKDLCFFESYLINKKEKYRNVDIEKSLFEYLDRLYCQNGIDAIGFKLMYGQAGAYKCIFDYFLKNKVAILHLTRCNLLDIIISREAAIKRDVFHSRTGEIKQMILYLDPRSVLNELLNLEKSVNKARKKVADLQLPHFEVYYEDLLDNNNNFKSLLEFLGVNVGAYKMISPLRKVNTKLQSEIVSNYEELESALQRTKYACMLTG